MNMHARVSFPLRVLLATVLWAYVCESDVKPGPSVRVGGGTGTCTFDAHRCTV